MIYKAMFDLFKPGRGCPYCKDRGQRRRLTAGRHDGKSAVFCPSCGPVSVTFTLKLDSKRHKEVCKFLKNLEKYHRESRKIRIVARVVYARHVA